MLRRALGLAACTALVACRRGPEPDRHAPGDASAAPDRDDHVARALASVLTSVRSRLSLAAPEWELQPLTFGHRLLVWLRDDRVVVYAVPELAPLFEQPLPGPRGATELAGGSVVVVGAGASLRVDPGANQPVRLPALDWVSGTVLLPERRDSGALWSVQRGSRLFVREKLEPGSEHHVGEPFRLDDYDGGPVVALRDGAVLYRAPGGVRRVLPPAGRPQPFRTDFAPWRLLPGRRVDQAWAVGADGRVELWQVLDRLSVSRRFSLPAPPFDVAASGDRLAAVVVEEGGGPRRFRLLVLTGSGQSVLDRRLAVGDESPDDNWAELAVRDRHVAFSETEELVAVGGTGALSVFRLSDGATLLER